METLLTPIEKPASLGMKFVYYLTKKQLGKVISPLKVYYSRMPLAFGMWSAKIDKLDQKLTLSEETRILIRERVARLNVCAFCMDLKRYMAVESEMNMAKFDALDEYSTSVLFTDAERAALDYASELTKDKKIQSTTFARLRNHYNEREVCDIIFLIVSEHVYNLTNLSLNIHSDMLCDISKKRI